MDKNTEKSCLEEISHFLCDEDRKVVLTEISNNWSIPHKESESILTKWLTNYNGGKNVLKEYLIRGVDLNGNCVITVVPERKLEALEKICPKYVSSLYSIELEGGNGRSLNISQPTKNKFISLPLDSVERKFKVTSLTVSPSKPIKNVPSKSVKNEPSKSVKNEPIESTPSTSKSSASKAANTLFGAAATKKEPLSNGTSAQVKVKDEKTSPKKISPKHDSPKKKAIKPSAAKSISSFFSAKPTASKPPVETKEKLVKVEPKAEPIPAKTEVTETVPPKESKKRVLSQSDDDSIPGTPHAKATPATKKPKKESVKSSNNKVAKNRSRIIQICDSSSDEEEASTSKKANGKIESDEETTVKKEKENTTPTKIDASGTMETDECANVNETQTTKKRGKVKKMVTKTFEDEEGYINSIRVMEEVSCSEDEVEEVPAKKKPVAKENGSTKESAVKEKKKVSPPTGKKQGSILNFFSKK